MERLNILLLNGLLRNKGNVRLSSSGADRLGVVAVVLLPTHERLHILRADDLHVMPERLELPSPVECACAGLKHNCALVDLRSHFKKLIAHHFALQNDATVAVHAMELENVLGDINAEGLDGHRSSPSVAGSLSLGVGGRAVHPIRWYDLYQTAGPEALEDKTPRPERVWNRIPDKVRGQLVQLALDEPELSPRELATRFTDTKSYFVSEASVYRLLKDHDLIASPAYIVMKAADEFKDKTTASNQLWQTDFTYLKVIGWGWFYLSTILDDFSRYIIAWKLCTTMKVGDVTQTLDLALQASGVDRAKVVQRPRLLSDNGPSYISADLAEWLDNRNMGHVRGAPCHPQTQGKIERWHQTLKNRILLENYYLPGDLEAQIDRFVDITIAATTRA